MSLKQNDEYREYLEDYYKQEKKLKFVDSVVSRSQWVWITLWNKWFN